VIPMQPFDRAWQLLKSYTSKPARTLNETDRHVRLHRVAGKENLGLPLTLTMEDLTDLQPRPAEFENRQFNVKNIDDEDTRGRVRDTYQELEPANFSTGDDMGRRRAASERGAREEDSDDFDYRPTIDGMRVNESEAFPTLSNDDMDPRLKYPYPKDANNPGDFAGGY